jgi:hypothetical protein
MKRRFLCGHRGKGKYCHRCLQEAEAAQRLEDIPVSVRAETSSHASRVRPATAALGMHRLQPTAPKAPLRRRQAGRDLDARARSEARLQRQIQSKVDPVDLSSIAHLTGLQAKARTILRAILDGADYRLFQGKRLEISQREIISVPVGLRYRLIFRASPLAVVDFMSHEQYNTFLTPSRVKAARRGKSTGRGTSRATAMATPTN